MNKMLQLAVISIKYKQITILSKIIQLNYPIRMITKKQLQHLFIKYKIL